MAKNTGLGYKQLVTAFRHENFEPVYLLFGEETFLVDELQQLLIEEALRPEERDFNLDIVYGADSDASGESVLALCAGYPAGAARRVVVVRDFDKLRGNRAFKTYAEHPNPQAVVLLVCSSKPNLSAHPYRALKQHAAWGHFKPLYDNEVPGWIKKRAEAQGYHIAPQAVQLLADYVGADLQALAAELDKLTTFAAGRERLTADDVLRTTGQTREHNVFELQKAIGKGRHAEAQHIAARMLRQASNARSEAIKIVAILHGYFTRLWKMPPSAERMSNQAVARRIGVSPYFVKEYVFSARRFDAAALERGFSALMAADYELKGGAARAPHLIITLLLGRLQP